MAKKTYQVCGAYVTHIEVDSESGTRLTDLNHGAILPEGVPQDRIDHLLSVGLIEEVDSGVQTVAPDQPTRSQQRRGGQSAGRGDDSAK